MSATVLTRSKPIIYAICDPFTNGIRYIGQSVDFGRRTRGHQHYLREGNHKNSHLQRWYNKCCRGIKEPTFKILQECLPGMVDACEEEWIAKGIAKGWKLCNVSEGGENPWNNPVVRAKLSETNRQRWQDPTYREKILSALRKHQVKQRIETIERREMKAGERLACKLQKARQKTTDRFRQEESRRCIPLTMGNTAFVPLTNHQWAMIDAEDWDRVNKYRWHLSDGRPKRTAGTTKQTVFLKHEVARSAKFQSVRCKNGNDLDCRKSNVEIGRIILGNGLPNKRVSPKECNPLNFLGL